MKKIKITLLSILAMLIMTIALSCGSDESSDSKLAGDIKIDGSSTVYPITEAVAEEFKLFILRLELLLEFQELVQFKKFTGNETQISNVDLLKKEAANCKNNKAYLKLSVAYDGLSVIVNPENDWVDYLTMDELNKIWHPDAQNNVNIESS